MNTKEEIYQEVASVLEELFEICDVLHVLHEGRLSKALPVAETTAEEVGTFMLGAEV